MLNESTPKKERSKLNFDDQTRPNECPSVRAALRGQPVRRPHIRGVRSITGPFLARLGATAAMISIISGVGGFLWVRTASTPPGVSVAEEDVHQRARSGASRLPPANSRTAL